MKKLFYTLILLSGISLHAQIHFEKGYFITNANERIDCYIRNLGWFNNPNEIEYKLTATEGDFQKKTISQISEFGIENQSKYRRFTTNIEKSDDNAKYLTNNKNPVWQEQTMFLKVLTEGAATLYSYKENNIIKYFYQTTNVPLEQLIYIKYVLLPDNSSDNVRTNNQFRQQLYNNVKCDKMTKEDFEKIGYNKESLLKHFAKFNSCGGNVKDSFTTKSEKGIFNLAVTAAVNRTSLSIRDPNQYYNVSTDLSSKIVFAGGLEAEYILPFNRNKWSIFVNPAYQKYSAEKTYANDNGLIGASEADVTYNAKVTYTNIEIPVGVRHYLFLNDKAKLFINAGVVFNFTSNSDIKFHSTINGDKTMRVESSNNYLIGVGFNFKNKASVELRLNTPRNILFNYTFWDGRYSSIGIVMAYKIL